MKTYLDTLEEYVKTLWAEGMSSDLIQNFFQQTGATDKKLVAIYLTQVYHYAIHTPRHQALAGANPRNTDFKYMQYCFHHALEETGHELMALNDIRSLGYEVTPATIPPPLTSTQLLVALLYKEAQGQHPLHHLGYTFWSENACPYIHMFMQTLMSEVHLNKNQMTFYSNHVSIDEDHGEEVRKLVNAVTKSDDDLRGMQRVAKITFDLTMSMVKDSFETYQALEEGKNTDYQVFAETQFANIN